MALEGTSASPGAPPKWLEMASDIRTLGFSSRDEHTVLHLKAPLLGDAAPQIFDQRSLFPEAAGPNDTALQVMSKITCDIGRNDSTSELYDRPLLRRFSSWRNILEHEVHSIELPQISSDSCDRPSLNLSVAMNAQKLSDMTPSPRQIRIVGKLDMVRHSTRSFALLLADNSEIRGILVDGTFEMLHKLLATDVTVLGKAVYRPSGSLLRIDATELLDTTEGRSAFSNVPRPFASQRRTERVPQSSKSGVAAFFGTWPGEETDEELQLALSELRR
jgi:hypothetical protein